MARIVNLRSVEGSPTHLEIDSELDWIFDGEGRLVAIPALIDPHVHFRTPGHEYKEDWRTGSAAALAGGITTVFDMPNNDPACVTRERMLEKKALINSQLKDVGATFNYGLYLGADRDHIDQIAACKGEAVGLKIYMGSTTGNLLVDDRESLEAIFAAAAEAGLVVAVHAECECMLRENQARYVGQTDPALHPVIRSRDVAIKASEICIELAAKTGAKLYLVHISTAEEMRMAKDAKADGIQVFAETTPNHLFLNDSAYNDIGTRAQMNPPIRAQQDQEGIWEGLQNGTLDTIGTDHAPHTLEEKLRPYGQAPSGIPGVETLLPLLLNAVNQGRLSLQRVIELTRRGPERVFGWPDSNDWVLIDLEETRTVTRDALHTKCGWSPYEGWELTGWPQKVICRGQLIDCRDPLKQQVGV